jgi:Tol biopolymer transport system component
MTASERFDRVFADVLADVAQPAYPDYIETALDRATRRAQRPSWTFPERWLPMTSLTRTAPFAPGMPIRRLLLVAILALLVAAVAIVASGVLQRSAPPYGPARNGVIVFEENLNLYLRDPATGTISELAASADFDVFPFFARDGSKLAYFKIDAATAETPNELGSLYVSELDGSDPRALLGPEKLRWASWAPNSQSLAVLTNVGQKGQLSIVGLDGSRRVLELDVDVEGWVDWRPPDGRELVFRGRDTTMGFFTVGVDGTGLTRIPIVGSTVTADGDVAVTPDGEQVVYSWIDDTLEIRIVDIDAGTLRVFGTRLPVPEGGPGAGPQHLGAPQLSTDGAKIVFGRYWNGGDDGINHQIWVASLAGNGEDAVAVSPVVRAAHGVNPFLVLLSPDGSQILVHRYETDLTWISDGNGLNRREVNWGRLYDLDWQRLAP